MAVLSSRGYERRRNNKSCSRHNLLAVSLPSSVYYLARRTKTAMLCRLAYTYLTYLSVSAVEHVRINYLFDVSYY